MRWNTLNESRGAESAIIYGNFPARNVVPQAKFPQELKIFPTRRMRTRADSAPLYKREDILQRGYC
jgi:hypothetical protein